MNRECLFCGSILDESRAGKYICEECERKMQLLKHISRVDKAKNNMEKSSKRYLNKKLSYENERDNVIHKIMDDNFRFNSVDEVCFALQLEKEGIAYYPNYRVGSYRVDFLLPNMKRIIEIDGEMYHTDENKEFLRERSIMRNIGEDYEIVRISASYVPKYIIKNIKEIIEFIVDKRKLDGRFRDTRWDVEYLEEYLNLQNYLRRNRK